MPALASFLLCRCAVFRGLEIASACEALSVSSLTLWGSSFCGVMSSGTAIATGFCIPEQSSPTRSLSTFPYIVLRPTGVYGPRERDYFTQIQSIKKHTDFAVGFQRQDITFVYVTDVVEAVFLALEKGETGRAYFLSDGEVYQSSEFSDLVHEALGRPWWIRIKAPIWLLRIITWCGDWWGRLTGKMSVLNNDKFNILRQRNWRCDITPARKELGFEPKVKLAEGVRRSIEWYQENKWL